MFGLRVSTVGKDTSRSALIVPKYAHEQRRTRGDAEHPRGLGARAGAHEGATAADRRGARSAGRARGARLFRGRLAARLPVRRRVAGGRSRWVRVVATSTGHLHAHEGTDVRGATGVRAERPPLTGRGLPSAGRTRGAPASSARAPGWVLPRPLATTLLPRHLNHPALGV